MVRFLVLASVIAMAATSSARAADPVPLDPNDKIAAELLKAYEKHQAATEKARQTLLAAFARQKEKLENNTRLKVEEQLKQLDQLEAERRAFEADPWRVPQSPSMKTAAADYESSLAAAKKEYSAAFDKAADAYRLKKDFAAAKAMLEGKQVFLRSVIRFDFDGAWIIHQSNGWSGRRVVKGDKVIDFNGVECTWERQRDQIKVKWPGEGWEKMQLDPQDTNTLKGVNGDGLTVTWTRVK